VSAKGEIVAVTVTLVLDRREISHIGIRLSASRFYQQTQRGDRDLVVVESRCVWRNHYSRTHVVDAGRDAVPDDVEGYLCNREHSFRDRRRRADRKLSNLRVEMILRSGRGLRSQNPPHQRTSRSSLPALEKQIRYRLDTW
jgi:hypothetical protein